MIFFGNRIITDVISEVEIILENGGPLNQYTWCPAKRQRDKKTDTQGECHVTTEAEIAVRVYKPRNIREAKKKA